MKLKFTAMILAIVLVFSGCSMDIGLKIQSDSKMVMTVQYDIEKDVFDLAMAMPGSSQQELQSAMAEANMKIVTIDGKQYYEIKESADVTPKELMATYESTGQSNCYITEDTFYLKVTSDGSGNSLLNNMDRLGTSDADYLSSIDPSSIKMTFTVEFQEDIVSTTGEKDAANPKKVTFNVPTDPSATSVTMFATSNAKVTIKSVQDFIKTSNKIARPVIKSVKAKKVKKKAKYATATVKIKNVKGAQKYEIEYSKYNKKTGKGVTITISSKKTTVKLKKLKKNQKYSVRVYAVKENYAGMQVMSKSSKVKKFKTKK